MPRINFPKSKSYDDVFAYVAGYIADHGYSPTYYEIAEQFSKARDCHYSTEWARSIVSDLCDQDRLIIKYGKHRSIEIKSQNKQPA